VGVEHGGVADQDAHLFSIAVGRLLFLHLSRLYRQVSMDRLSSS
jgi:hypothetical protein